MEVGRQRMGIRAALNGIVGLLEDVEEEGKDKGRYEGLCERRRPVPELYVSDYISHMLHILHINREHLKERVAPEENADLFEPRPNAWQLYQFPLRFLESHILPMSYVLWHYGNLVIRQMGKLLSLCRFN